MSTKNYSKKQVDEMLNLVETEFETIMAKNASKDVEAIETEDNEEVIEVAMAKSEEVEEETTNEVESDEDYQSIDELYGSMNKSEIEAHYQAAKKAYSEEINKSDDDDLSEHAKSQRSKEAQKAAVQANSAKDKSGKSKIDAGYDKVTNHKEKKIADEEFSAGSAFKSEGDEDLFKENEELKKNLQTTNELLEKLFKTKKAPEGKALTGLNVIKKSEGGEFEEETKETKIASMSKSEITSKLNSIDYGSITKSDRNAINDYCLNNTSVDSIKHLITE